MFFPSLHHKIQFQSVNSVHVCFTLILLNIQNRNHSLNSSPTLLPRYKTDSFSGFVVEMSQHFVYQQYDKIQQKSIDSHSHFPNKFQSNLRLLGSQKFANTNLRKIPFTHFPPGVAKGVQIQEWQIPEELQIDYSI